jgi:hypothetical protein
MHKDKDSDYNMPFNVGGNIIDNNRAKLINTTTIVQNGLTLHLSAGIANSYPGSGSTWYDISGQGNHTWDPKLGFGNFQGNSTGAGNKFYSNNSSFAKAYKTANGGSGYTTIAWVRVTSTSGWQKLMGHSDGDSYIDLYAQSGTSNYHQEDGSTVWVNTSTVTNDTYTLNGAGYLMLTSTNSNGGTTTTPTYTFTIGNDPNSTGTQAAYPWYGYIHTVMVYNRVLSTAEIIQNYQATRMKFEQYYNCGYGCSLYNYDPGCTHC